MSKKTIFWLLMTFTIILLASGCKPVCTPAEYAGFKVFPMSPGDGTIASSLTPTFEWKFNEECLAQNINLEITKDAPGPGTVYTSGSSATSYTLTTPLEPASKYLWKTYASFTGGELGKISYSRILYTGPLCSSGVPVAPILDTPKDGEFAETIGEYWSYTFHWHYPGDCLPTSYLYEFAEDPGFQNIIDSGETQDHKSFLNKSFPDCATLYWRVAAKIGNQVGPWTDPAMFHFINKGTCWQNHYLSDDYAEISGRVYRDMCDQTGQFVSSNMLLNPGCVKTNNYNVRADGVYASNEHGLMNVVVDLGSGPCPSTGLDQATTYGENGGFDFVVMTPGEYCLSVRRDQTGHDYAANVTFDLMNGMWTEPGSYSPYLVVAQETITLSPGYHEVKQNFGWDKFDGIVKFFIEPTYCRKGPIPHCDPLRIYDFGEIAPMMARSADGKWVRTQFDGQMCYFRNFESLPDDLPEGFAGIPDMQYELLYEELEIYPEPPPCPTPTPTPRPKPDSPSCSGYTSESACLAAGCSWIFGAAAGACY